MKDKPTPVIVVITGLPCTGKTTLGRKVANTFNYILLSKDVYKEKMFAAFGAITRSLSMRLDVVALDIMYETAHESLTRGKSVILETNFEPKYANKRLLELKNKHNASIYQVRCWTAGHLLIDRFCERADIISERHPGYCDAASRAEWIPKLRAGKIEMLDLGCDIFDVNTSDFEKIDYAVLYRHLSKPSRVVFPLKENTGQSSLTA